VLYFDQTNTKSGKQREIPLSPVLADMLRERRKVRGIKDVERFLFTWQGKPIERFATAFTTARKRAKLGPDVTPHVCRHTFASAFVINGGDIYRLQKYLGHSTIALTQRYAHLSQEYLRAGVEFIGAPRGHNLVTDRQQEAVEGKGIA
jgi:integrase